MKVIYCRYDIEWFLALHLFNDAIAPLKQHPALVFHMSRLFNLAWATSCGVDRLSCVNIVGARRVGARSEREKHKHTANGAAFSFAVGWCSCSLDSATTSPSFIAVELIPAGGQQYGFDPSKHIVTFEPYRSWHTAPCCVRCTV